MACSARGWDVSNKAGLTEVFKPVIHEESIETRIELPDWNCPSVDFDALGRYISSYCEENYGHCC